MADDRTTHNTYPTDDAPLLTGEYAECSVCNVRWQVKSNLREDAKSCSFCGAGAEAITIHDEGPTAGHFVPN